MKKFKVLLLTLTTLLPVSVNSTTADEEKLQFSRLIVRVREANGEPVRAGQVEILERPWRGKTDVNGIVEFSQLPPGFYLVQAFTQTGAKASATVTLQPGQVEQLTLTVEAASFHEEVTVSGAQPGRLWDNPLAVTVLADDALQQAVENSLGEIMRTHIGVRSSFYSPGASRPLVRGFGGGRIRILDNGLDVGDVSDTSPDHGIALAS